MEKVLVIDDEKSILDLLKVSFKKEGWNTTTCLSAPKALELVENNDNDLIVCDIKMPQMSGLQILKQVKEKKPNILNVGLETEKNNVLGFVQTSIHHVMLPSAILSGEVQFYTLDPAESNRTLGIRSYSLSYVQPWFLNITPLSVGIERWIKFNREQSFDTDYYDVERDGGNLFFSYPIITDKIWVTSRFKKEKVND